MIFAEKILINHATDVEEYHLLFGNRKGEVSDKILETISTLKCMKEIAWEVWKYKSMEGHVTPDWKLMDKEFQKRQETNFNEWYHENV